MAKGNMFLGMARGKVGDVVFYRADGQQLSRVRNRNPRNPRSNAQLFQRAIMSTIVQAYTAGKAIFDHSFQGYSVGAQCQRQFMSLNAKMLRQLVATDINTPLATNSQKARVVAPGVNVPAPNPYIISRGSYQQSLFTYDASDGCFYAPEKQTDETVAAYASRNNLIAGDIYTFIVFAVKKDMAYQSNLFDDALASQNYCSFGWVRMIVKAGLSNVQTAVNTYKDLFEVQNSGGDFDVTASTLENFPVGTGIEIASFTVNNSNDYTNTGAIGVIRSRFDQDLRSDSVLNVKYGFDAEDMFGIASDYILGEWQQGTTNVGNSNLILEGGEG